MSKDEIYQALAAFGPCTRAEIQAAFGVGKSAACNALKSLERYGDAKRMIGQSHRSGRLIMWVAI